MVLRLEDMTLPDAASLAEVEWRAWSLEENAAVLRAAFDHLVHPRHGHGHGHTCRLYARRSS